MKIIERIKGAVRSHREQRRHLQERSARYNCIVIALDAIHSTHLPDVSKCGYTGTYQDLISVKSKEFMMMQTMSMIIQNSQDSDGVVIMSATEKFGELNGEIQDNIIGAYDIYVHNLNVEVNRRLDPSQNMYYSAGYRLVVDDGLPLIELYISRRWASAYRAMH